MVGNSGVDDALRRELEAEEVLRRELEAEKEQARDGEGVCRVDERAIEAINSSIARLIRIKGERVVL